MTVSLGYVIYYVDDVAASLDFFTSSFGLTQRFVTPEGDYGELDTGTTTLAFASVDLATKNLQSAGGFVPLDPSGTPQAGTITLTTDDVAAGLAAAVANGGRSYVAPVDKPWGQTVAYVVDPSGILVEIATPIAAG